MFVDEIKKIKHRLYMKKWRISHPSKSNTIEQKREYRRSFYGYFVCTFARIQGRVRKGNKRYLGLECMSKEHWKLFLNDTESERMDLWKAWVDSGYKRRLSPSIDRVDPKLGYTRFNCRWLPQWENSSIGGSVSKPQKKAA